MAMKQKSLVKKTQGVVSGFTLIELLVVVLIIIVLAAISYPTIGSMRATAKRSECMGQLRSWGVAMGGYAADHDGRVNWEHWPSIGWEELKASPYVHYWTGGTVDFEGHNHMGAFDYQLKQRCCPAVKVSPGTNAPVSYATIQPVGISKVGITGRVNGNSSDYSLARIDNAAHFMLMIDAMPGSSYSIQSTTDFTSRVKPLTEDGVDERHNNHTVNALLGDFSVRSMTWSEIQKGLKLGQWVNLQAPASGGR